MYTVNVSFTVPTSKQRECPERGVATEKAGPRGSAQLTLVDPLCEQFQDRLGHGHVQRGKVVAHRLLVHGLRRRPVHEEQDGGDHADQAGDEAEDVTEEARAHADVVDLTGVALAPLRGGRPQLRGRQIATRAGGTAERRAVGGGDVQRRGDRHVVGSRAWMSERASRFVFVMCVRLRQIDRHSSNLATCHRSVEILQIHRIGEKYQTEQTLHKKW